MSIDIKSLTKGEARKFEALKKSLGDEIANEAFAKYLAAKPAIVADQVDPIAVKLEEAVAAYANDKSFKLGVYGYTIKKAKGKGASGFVAVKNEKPE